VSAINHESAASSPASLRNVKQRKSEPDVIAKVQDVSGGKPAPYSSHTSTLNKMHVSPIHSGYIKQAQAQAQAQAHGHNTNNSSSASSFGSLSKAHKAAASQRAQPSKVTTPPPIRKNSTSAIQSNSTHANNTLSNSNANTPNMQRSSSYEVHMRNKVDCKNMSDKFKLSSDHLIADNRRPSIEGSECSSRAPSGQASPIHNQNSKCKHCLKFDVFFEF
jgi:hypothetical protein